MYVLSGFYHGACWVGNTAYWGIRGYQLLEQVGKTTEYFHDVQPLFLKDEAYLKDYVEVACKIGSLAIDFYVFKTDWEISGLKNRINKKDTDIIQIKKELDAHKLSSLQFQQISLSAHILGKCLDGNDPDNETTEKVLRLLASRSSLNEGEGYISSASKGLALVASTEVVAQVLNISLECAEEYRYSSTRICKTTNYKEIPTGFHTDPVFSQFKCSITNNPVRFPVITPSIQGHPGDIFERKAIIQWLTTNRTNPCNGTPLRLNQLREHLVQRQLIETRMVTLGIPLT